MSTLSSNTMEQRFKMSKSKFAASLIMAATIFSTSLAGAQLKSVELPAPQKEGGKPLMQVLNERKTGRSFTGEKLPVQTLSNLLWAAFGKNRPDGRRTAPSAKNWQEIDIYLAAEDGLYIYDAGRNELNQVLDKDVRSKTGTQPFVGTASVNLVYVADNSRVNAGGLDAHMLTGADTGFIAQNVYLYCASEGLTTVVRVVGNAEELSRIMKLRPDQKIILAQSVGYPKK